MSDVLEFIIISIILIIILAAVIYIVLHLKKEKRIEFIQDALKEFLQKTGSIDEIGRDIKNIYSNINTILGSKTERGKLGEFSLEMILKDSLPADKIKMQYSLPGVGIIDAAIFTKEGSIPIDSKFPLENYRNMVDTDSDSGRESYKNTFRRDLAKHIEKVKNYIQLKSNTTSFALLYIPSEAIYHYLITDEFDTVRQASMQNVYIVSPTTLALLVNIIRLGIRREQISKEARLIHANLQNLDRLFANLGGNLSTLGRHIKDAQGAFEKTNNSFDQLITDFKRAKEPSDKE